VSRGAVRPVALLALAGLLGLAGCRGSGSPHAAASGQPGASRSPLPSCAALVGAIPATVLAQPTVDPGQPLPTASDFVAPGTQLCPVRGTGPAEGTPLKVTIFVSRPDGADAKALGELAHNQADGYCAAAATTSGSPVTSAWCASQSIMEGEVGGWALVHGPAVVGVRVASAAHPGGEAAYQQQLQATARQIADAVAGGL
jgi:hypothetical protein